MWLWRSRLINKYVESRTRQNKSRQRRFYQKREVWKAGTMFPEKDLGLLAELLRDHAAIYTGSENLTIKSAVYAKKDGRTHFV